MLSLPPLVISSFFRIFSFKRLVYLLACESSQKASDTSFSCCAKPLRYGTVTCSHNPLTSLLLVHFMNENTDEIEGEGHTGTSSQLEFESLSLSNQPCSFTSLTFQLSCLSIVENPQNSKMATLKFFSLTWKELGSGQTRISDIPPRTSPCMYK